MDHHHSLGRRGLGGLLGLGAAAALLGGNARPAAAATTAEIKARRKLMVGVLADLPPFGGTDSSQQIVGYDPDVAKLMARDLGVELEIVPVTGPNRIPYLLTNKVDVLIATFGITAERARQVLFSNPYSALDIVLLAPKSMNIRGPEDLKGVRIGVARASTQDTAITAMAPREARIMRFDDDATAVQSIISGQVQVLGANNVVQAQLARTQPQLQLEPKITLRRQANGMAFRKADTELRDWTNTFLAKIVENGELAAIYKRWFGAEMPPLPEMPAI
ncbi:transporter substrate-binding domain-containing protein [Roseomonas sp. NAR14]|uniref:Transporter substrate-binding domain-containing protein n=1 Tax=Roseomonas acroporae TaxID=2937791 RepID=A0A9X2BW27_9PROT|nr:transporter substrate-binding domain-containing protein [Roseomonas acroporae]MCK8783390.1 transporter substrate-binding domain-containing protein [Roseomonas acroporae]